MQHLSARRMWIWAIATILGALYILFLSQLVCNNEFAHIFIYSYNAYECFCHSQYEYSPETLKTFGQFIISGKFDPLIVPLIPIHCRKAIQCRKRNNNNNKQDHEQLFRCELLSVPKIFLQHIICLCFMFHVTNDRQFDVCMWTVYMCIGEVGYMCVQRHNRYRILIHMLHIYLVMPVYLFTVHCSLQIHIHMHTQKLFIYVNCTHVVYIQFSYWAGPYVNVDLFATCL